MCRFFEVRGVARRTGLFLCAASLFISDESVAIKVLSLGALILFLDVGHQMRVDEQKEDNVSKVLTI